LSGTRYANRWNKEIEEITYDEICMTAKEVIEIVKESKLWAPLTENEKQEVIKHALKSAQLSIPEEDIRYTVGEVYLDFE
jgi:hypothetical protein